MMKQILLSGLLVAMCTIKLSACPFCSAVSQTFSEEMESMDIVVFAELVAVPDDADEEVQGELPRCTFKITEIIQGDAWYTLEDEIEVHYFGPQETGGTFLIMGTDPPEIMWGTPLIIEQRAQEYLRELMTLPKDPERLEFFINHLEDEDELLARDAYDEFAKTPYDGVKALKNIMDHDQLMAWIKNPDTPATRRRLYFTMLGVCGTSEDCDVLEGFMRSDNPDDKSGLNALIACYLSLAGADGLPIVEELFLANEDAEYADTYAAIMAVRFHGNDNDLIPREELLPGLRAVLKRPDLADLVIPDLARWEDWDVMPELVRLFEEADEDSSWVRVPVINYLRACPNEGAEDAITKLEKIDPESVERARAFFPFSQFAGPSRGESAMPEEAVAEDEDPTLIARKSVAPQRGMGTVVVETPAAKPWLYPTVFGGLLVVALLIKLTSKS